MAFLRIPRVPVPTEDIADLAVTTPKIADLAVSTPKVADLAITTAKLTDGAVVPAKVAAGVMSESWSLTRTPTVYTLAGGAEESIGNLVGDGLVVILFNGDGDGVFNMRTYTDGILADTIPTNERIIAIYAPDTALEVRIQNPTAATATHNSSGFEACSALR